MSCVSACHQLYIIYFVYVSNLVALAEKGMMKMTPYKRHDIQTIECMNELILSKLLCTKIKQATWSWSRVKT